MKCCRIKNIIWNVRKNQGQEKNKAENTDPFQCWAEKTTRRECQKQNKER